MAVDFQNLPLEQEDISVSMDNWVPPTEFPPPLPEGVYTLRQGRVTDAVSKPNKEGKLFLLVSFDPHIVEGGEYDGKRVPFDQVSASPFERQGVKVSMLIDHLKALGVTERISDQRMAGEIIVNSEGKPFKVALQWEGYCGHKGTSQEGSPAFTLRGERNFPSLNGGASHADETTCPTCQKTVRARVRISRRIPA